MAANGFDRLPAITVYDEIGSTNAELIARGRAGAPHGAAVRARVQTSGRGQRAHGWTSPAGGLYLSVLVRPQVPAHMLPGLPIACALGILGALQEAGCPQARLKWPNDVVVGNRKLAGILTEFEGAASDAFAVCGVGVNMRAPQVPPRASAGAAALAPIGLLDVAGEAPTSGLLDLDELAEQVRAGIVYRLDAWQREARGARLEDGPLSQLMDAYNEQLAYRDKPVDVYAIDGGVADAGVFAGVDAWGRAVVVRHDGERVAYDAAAVSLRPAPAGN